MLPRRDASQVLTLNRSKPPPSWLDIDDKLKSQPIRSFVYELCRSLEIETSDRDEKVNKRLASNEGWQLLGITPSKEGPVYTLGRYFKAPPGELGEHTNMSDYDPFAEKP
jgi:hypothetical protein